MRIYVPDKNEGIINEVLKDLYLLRQSIVHADSKIDMIDKIRGKLKDLLED